MWSELQPEFVKIDKHFVQSSADDHIKYHFVRDMGSAYGPGDFIARPAPQPLVACQSGRWPSAAAFFMGQFALFTYVQPFLEAVTQVEAPLTLPRILLVIGVAGFLARC